MRRDRLGTLVSPRFDEMLYSMAARLSVYLGIAIPGELHRGVFGDDMPVFDTDLPVGLDFVVRSGVFGPANAQGAAREWTLFPYYAAFAAGPRVRAAEQAMAGTGTWPQAELHLSQDVARDGPLRFCLECREDMLDRHPDLWWRRAHQLPGVMVCPEHGAPLRWSAVGDVRGSRYVPADLEVCPSTAPAVVARQDPRVCRDLLVLARMSDALLDREPQGDPEGRRMDYLDDLRRLRLLNREGAADLHGVARAMDGYWGTTLDVWPGLRRAGRCRERWLGGLLWSGRCAPTLHHLLLQGMLDGRLRRAAPA